ncbi:hypothetical protein H072_4886 [Dactylellina haptotyla CBS 200.50]|uniref:Small ribosomal subunit protein uS10m n=1 Tax=Dactylellina haptotyla (strain CBS 200.50) TaxID=1284197 RepID=S8ADT8_DACHA|nr:hypothetical protein H072_4886 [Dactylellina haptotyla CBS 200.50]
MLRRATASAVRTTRRHFSTQKSLYQATTTEISTAQQQSQAAVLASPKFAQAYDKNFDDSKLPDAPVPLAVRAIYHAPLKVQATYNVPSCDLQIRSFTLKNVEFFADFALRAAYYLKLPAFGPIPLPRRTERWTVPKSNFVHKKAQQNFERVTYKRLVQIKDGHPDVVQIWLAFLRKHEYHGIGMKANVYTFEKLGAGSHMAEKMAEIKQRAADGKADHNQQLSAIRGAFTASHHLSDLRKAKGGKGEKAIEGDSSLSEVEKSLRLAEAGLAGLSKSIKKAKHEKKQVANDSDAKKAKAQKSHAAKTEQPQTESPVKKAKQRLSEVQTKVHRSLKDLEETSKTLRKEFKTEYPALRAELDIGREKVPVRLSEKPAIHEVKSESVQEAIKYRVWRLESNMKLIKSNTDSVVRYFEEKHGKYWRETLRAPAEQHAFIEKLHQAEEEMTKSWYRLSGQWNEMHAAFGTEWTDRLAAEGRSVERLQMMLRAKRMGLPIGKAPEASEIKASKTEETIQEASSAETENVEKVEEKKTSNDEPLFKKTETTVEEKTPAAPAEDASAKEADTLQTTADSAPQAAQPEPTVSEDAVAADKVDADLSNLDPSISKSAKEIEIETAATPKENVPESPRTPQPTESEADVAADSDLVPPPTQEATKEDFRSAKEIQIDEAMKKKDE